MAFTQTELDRMVCANPECNHQVHKHEVLVLLTPCHPEAGFRVRYSSKLHTLLLSCRECDEIICEIAVAWGH
jgi:hypothetical protein